MKRIIAQARKELTQTFRDKLTLTLAIILPLILLVLFGKAISFSVTNLPVVIQDLDQTPLSRRYIDACNTSLTFRVHPLPIDARPETMLDGEKARAAIIIPQNFERDYLRGGDAQVQWLIDATDANTANIVRGNAAAVTQAFASQKDFRESTSPIKAEMRMWHNPGRESDKYIGSGALAVVLALFPPLLAALATSREGEQKTILQVYVSSISAPEFLLGKTLAFFVIALTEWALAVLASMMVFGLRFAGDPTPFVVGTLLYLFCNVGFGVMVGAVVPNQATAIQAVAMVSFLLSFLLSGFMFPISNIPAGIRWIAGVVPARYFIEIARDAFLRGGGWAAVWHAPLMLALLGLFYFVLAWRKMRHMQVDL
ncbi:MAG: ABC transporter permease [Acidobacteriota bacterium]